MRATARPKLPESNNATCANFPLPRSGSVQRDHWSECGRAASSGDRDTLGRPLRSVLLLGVSSKTTDFSISNICPRRISSFSRRLVQHGSRCRVRLGLLQIALPPDKAQCIMHGRQEPDWTSEALRQARYGSPLVSSASPDVVAGTALVGFSVKSI